MCSSSHINQNLHETGVRGRGKERLFKKEQEDHRFMMADDRLKHVLRMKEGTDETSYAKTSYIQKEVLLSTKSIKEEAIRDIYCKERPTTLCIADLGCSSNPLNTLSLAAELIQTVEMARRERLEHDPQEYHIYLNDLPGNDFNTLFKSMGSFEDSLKQQIGHEFGRHCFVNGVPGSFYGRLFPTNSLHFVHSSYSLHWLSQVPQGIQDNKENIYIGWTSPPSVLKAYCEQYQKDFTRFLQYRSKEVIAGGRMVLTVLGRENGDLYSKRSSYMWDFLAIVLNNMAFEGLIDKEKIYTFNIPSYPPSPPEFVFSVETEGSFDLNQVYVNEVNWRTSDQKTDNTSNTIDSYDFAKCMRSVWEPFLISHFGEEIIEEVFKRYCEVVQSSMAKEENFFTNITVSLTRKQSYSEI